MTFLPGLLALLFLSGVAGTQSCDFFAEAPSPLSIPSWMQGTWTYDTYQGYGFIATQDDISLTMPVRPSRLAAWRNDEITLEQETVSAEKVIIKQTSQDSSGYSYVENLTFTWDGTIVHVDWYYRKSGPYSQTIVTEYDYDLGYCHKSL